MKIAIDLDGVVVDLVAELLPLLSKEAGRLVERHHITEYDIGAALGLDEVQMERVWELAKRENVYHRAQPISGVIDSLKTLSSHDLWFVTSRSEELRSDTKVWLSNYGLRVEQLLHRDNGQKVVREDEFHVLIEDNAEELNRYASLVSYGLLFDHPWNRATTLPGNIYRVYSWKEIASYVKKFGEYESRSAQP